MLQVVSSSPTKGILNIHVFSGNCSVEDLTNQCTAEYDMGDLIVVPALRLQDYNSVPHHVTGLDLRMGIEKEEEEILNSRMATVEAMKDDVQDILNRWGFQMSNVTPASEEINSLLFPEIYIGDISKPYPHKCKCKACASNTCNVKQSKQCSLNLGYKYLSDRTKNDCKFKWQRTLVNMDPNNAEENFKKVKVFAEKEIKNGIKASIKQEILGIAGNLIGRQSENELTETMEVLHKGKPGLLLQGFKVKKYLRKFFDNFNIKLKTKLSKVKGGNNGQKQQRDITEIDHDVLFVEPKEDNVEVMFVQAKAQLNIPSWTEVPEKIKSVSDIMRTACGQAIVDIETFSSVASYLLTKEQFDIINFTIRITMSNLDDIPEEDICQSCRSKYVFEQEKSYQMTNLRELFNAEPPKKTTSSNATEVFKLLTAVYVGGGSLVELRHRSDQHREEKKHMEMVEKDMKKALNDEQTKPNISNRWISRNLKLGPEQFNVYRSKQGLQNGYALIGAHGSGKTILLKLETQRVIEKHVQQQTEATIYLAIWERKAEDLIAAYKDFERHLIRPGTITIKVVTKEELCQLTSVSHKDLDTTSVINNICQNLSAQDRHTDTYLFIDEIQVENPSCTRAEDLIGKAPFMLRGKLYPWSNLEPHGVHLIASVTPDNQDLVKLLDLKEADVTNMEKLKPAHSAIPTVALWRVFRCTKKIHNFLKHLQILCTEKDRESSYVINPQDQLDGHEIHGEVPKWISCKEHKHMICQKDNCQDCFLRTVDKDLTEVVDNLKQEYDVKESDICIVVSCSDLKLRNNDSVVKNFFQRNHPGLKVKINFELEGLEEPVVIVIRNGGSLGCTISHAMSRAMCKLIVISTDDNKILTKASEQGKLLKIKTIEKNVHSMDDIIEDIAALFKEDSSVSTAFGEIRQHMKSHQVTQTMSTKDAFRSIASITSRLQSFEEKKDPVYIQAIVETLDKTTFQCFNASNVKAFLLDNNTTANTFSKELLGDIRERMSQVIEARGQYAAILILEAKLTISGGTNAEISNNIRDIIMSFQKDREVFEAVLEAIETTNKLNEQRFEYEKLREKVERMEKMRTEVSKSTASSSRKRVAQENPTTPISKAPRLETEANEVFFSKSVAMPFSPARSELVLDDETATPVVVHDDLGKHLKPHQQEGIRFMYNALFKDSHEHSGGCVLAHCMGLGKTLQAISMVDTVIKHAEIAARKVLILCPKTLVANWVEEFCKWLPDPTRAYKLYQWSKSNEINRDWDSEGGVLVLGYEKFKSLDSLPNPDIVICDEGHALKNSKSIIHKKLSTISTKKRVVLTGTPLQNNLTEFYNIVNFTNPGILESEESFRTTFAKPIEGGMTKDSSDKEVQTMKETLCILTNYLKKCLNRKDQLTLQPFLASKIEFDIAITLSQTQVDLYKDCVMGMKREGRRCMRDHKKLLNIWNHPLPHLRSIVTEGCEPESPESQGTKLSFLLSFAKAIVDHGEKLLVFTQSRVSLDLIEEFFASKHGWTKGEHYLRMDGTTCLTDRKKGVARFNDENNKTCSVYLITSKTGGQGLNITAANRVIIYDISWNPTVDIQAIYRSYRLGQTRNVYIYRILAKGISE